MADEEVALEEDGPGQGAAQRAEQGPLVALTFQKHPARKQKYLEAEPQALGITQIGFSVFRTSWAVVTSAYELHGAPLSSAMVVIVSVLTIIAGSLAIAAQNLHLPTLKACLGMQVVACVAIVFSTFFNFVTGPPGGLTPYACWYHDYNHTSVEQAMCRSLEDAELHIMALDHLIRAALIAITITLAAYCCKVVNCCSPAPKMPVITVQAPPAPAAQVPPPAPAAQAPPAAAEL